MPGPGRRSLHGPRPLVVDKNFEFLATIVAQGTSLLIVEQYVYRAVEFAHQVYLLSSGHIVYNRTPSELEGQDIFERYLGVEAGLA
jgi:branched-chain amino acid transport system ATP-binding protein